MFTNNIYIGINHKKLKKKSKKRKIMSVNIAIMIAS